MGLSDKTSNSKHQDFRIDPGTLESVVNSLDVMIWSGCPLTNRVLYVSPAAERIYGHPPDEFMREPALWRKVVLAEDADIIGEFFQTLLSKGEVCAEYRIMRRDGDIRWVSDRAVVVKDDGGAVIRFDGIVTDISEQKRSQNDFLQNQQYLQSIVQGVAIILVAVDNDAVFTLADGLGLASLGMTTADFMGKKLEDVYHADRAMQECWRRALRGERFTEVLVYDRLAFEMRYSPVRKSDGTLNGAVAVGTDVSALRESEDRFRRLAGATSEGVALQRQGVFTDVNEMMCHIFGLSREELIGKTLPDIVAPESQHLLKKSRPLEEQRYNVDCIRKDGTIFPVEIFERTGVDESVFSRVLIVRDITIQTRTLEQYRRAKEVAEQTAHLKSEFLANMTHEIRTPLHAVLSVAELLSHTNLDAHQKEFLQTIEKSGHGLLELINDVLDFSKIEAGKLVLEHASFPIEDLFVEVADLEEHRAIAKNLRFSMDIDPAIPKYLCGDFSRLRQVLLNLTNNAIKFTDRGEVIVTAHALPSAAPNRAGVRFSVTDTGVGISAKLRDRLFQSFSQIDASTTRRYGGTGLGLAISKAIVQAMNGTIEVESTEGKGSEFSVILSLEIGSPTLAFPEHAARDQAGIASAPNLSIDQQKTILIVEDNPVNQRVAQSMLTRIGYQFDTASDGCTALEMIRQRDYDLVLMDCQMPVLDGYDTTRAIRRLEPAKRAIPVVAMTANALRGDAEKCLEAGMDSYISKPFSLETLRSTLGARLLGETMQRAPRVSAARDTDAIDETRLSMIFGDDIEAHKSFIEVFLTDFAGRIARVPEHIRAVDFDRVFHVAHTLKGSSGNIGATALTTAVLTLERAARSHDIAACVASLPPIHVQFARASARFQNKYGMHLTINPHPQQPPSSEST